MELYGGKWDDWPEDIDPVRYLIDAAYGMRLGVPEGDGGLTPQTWGDVVCYGEKVCGLTERWELKALMDMSEAYVVEFMCGKDALRSSPMDRFRRSQDAS